MGSPISGILAEIKLRKLEKIIETEFKGKINFWVRYVDDVFAIINSNTDENLILNDLTVTSKCNIPYNYKIASLRSYINRAITVSLNQELLKEEIKKIEDIATENSFKKNLIHKLYKNRVKTLNHIPGRQKPKKKFCASIPFCKGAPNIPESRNTVKGK